MYDVVATSKFTVGSGSSLIVTGKGQKRAMVCEAHLGPPDLAIIDERRTRQKTIVHVC